MKARLNILITGGTGTGKTTLLNALSSFIPESERIVTIEDAAELQLQQHHVVRLETRPPNIEGKGEVLARDLVKNALRMRPDRIIIGECRGGEALDMLQAMNTGHEGSMTTVHANTPRDALSRLEAMVGMGGVHMSESAGAPDHRARAQPHRPADARHRRQAPHHQHLRDHRHGGHRDHACRRSSGSSSAASDADGKIVGEFRATGVRPASWSASSATASTPPKSSSRYL